MDKLKYGTYAQKTKYLYPKYDDYRLRGVQKYARLLAYTGLISRPSRGFNYRGFYRFRTTRRRRRRYRRRYFKRRFYRRRRYRRYRR